MNGKNRQFTERKTKLNKLSKLKETIVDLSDKEYVNEVKSAFSKYQVVCDEAKQMHVTLLGLLPKDEATKHETWYKAKMLNVNDFIADVSKWLSKTQSCAVVDDGDNGKEEVHVEPHDSISNVESNTSSKWSSHKSSKSSTSSARIKAEADKAALMARAAALKEKHALEEQAEMLRRSWTSKWQPLLLG